ncbi:MAG: hypothetical protein S4CHLAM102_02090 [Chlamydiia bacterium]|nr:hypothetical protein [Chlamydiia bacterium]
MSHLRSLRIADVELFITAANFQNLGKAAAVHFVSQSGASTAIKRVEEALGKRLSMHTKKGFSLTNEGKLLLPQLEKWVAELSEIALTAEKTPIRLVTTHAIASVLLPTALEHENIEVTIARPDLAYQKVMQNEADIAIVLDNMAWEGVEMVELGSGKFDLFAKEPKSEITPVLLPEDQMEVVAFMQMWKKIAKRPLPIQARVPSWSLIAKSLQKTSFVGFLPEFLAKSHGLKSVGWLNLDSRYRLLALYKPGGKERTAETVNLVEVLKRCF